MDVPLAPCGISPQRLAWENAPRPSGGIGLLSKSTIALPDRGAAPFQGADRCNKKSERYLRHRRNGRRHTRIRQSRVSGDDRAVAGGDRAVGAGAAGARRHGHRKRCPPVLPRPRTSSIDPPPASSAARSHREVERLTCELASREETVALLLDQLSLLEEARTADRAEWEQLAGMGGRAGAAGGGTGRRRAWPAPGTPRRPAKGS